MNLKEYIANRKLSQVEFAQLLGVTQGAVWQWIAGKKPVSAESCIAIERATAGEVRCEDLRPDIDWHVVRSKRRPRRQAIAA